MTGARLTGFVFLLAAATGLAAPGYTLEEGSQNGVPSLVAKPTVAWTHRVLLVAQDRRPESADLRATLPLEGPFCKTLLADGWIVGASAFPRNGTVIADAVRSLLALMSQIRDQYGTVDHALVMGDGLGGLDAVLLSEMPAGAFSGAIAVDPTLYAREAGESMGVSLAPKIPLVIVSTQKEALSRALAYVTSKMPRLDEDPRPALFVVSRDGLCNVNDSERFTAFKLIESWMNDGRSALPSVEPSHPFVDITQVPPARPPKAKVSKEASTVICTVVSADPFDGSLQLDARPEDFAQAGFAQRSYLSLSIGGMTARGRMMPRGFVEKGADWLVYPDADGLVRVAPRFDGVQKFNAGVGATAVVSPPLPAAP